MRHAPSLPVRIMGALGIVLLFAALAGCGNADPIRVGFSGPLEGKYSDLGIHGRYGVQLCVEHINAAGGIGGRQIDLIVRHDGETEADAVAANAELMRENVVAIIGHMTSQQSMAATAALKGTDMPLVSPTTSTHLLSGIRDNFFRVMPQSDDWAISTADYAIQQRYARRVFIVYDTDNRSYTETFSNAFAERFRSLGGEIAATVPIVSSRMAEWDTVLHAIRTTDPDSLFMALSARDTASLAQSLYQAGIRLPLYSSPWAYTSDLVSSAGRHIEGLTASISYDPNNQRPEYVRFREQYKQRFGWEPNFAAAHGYEAMLALAAALEKTGGKRQGLMDALASLGRQNGIISEFEIDTYGDVQRPPLILTIRNGSMTRVQ